jgi:hypothetical protein
MIKSILFSGAIASMVYGYQELKPRPIEQVVIEVPEAQRNFNEYLRESARAYGIPESIAVAMMQQESGGKKNAIRFEPGQMERARAISKASGDQLRMYSSSHCQMQIMGWHAPKYGLAWSDLYDSKTCAELGMKIMGDCVSRHKGKKPLDKVKGALTCYNGSEEYAKAILNRIGQKLLEVHLESELKG